MSKISVATRVGANRRWQRRAYLLQMAHWRIALKALVQDQRGATAIEYGLIAALISVAAVAAFQLIGTNLSNTFTNIATQI